MSHRSELSNLLMRLFSTEDWHRWLHEEYGSSVVFQTPSLSVSPIKYFTDSVEVLGQHGHIDDDFFARLVQTRPKRARAIHRVRDKFRAQGVDGSLVGMSRPGEVQRIRPWAITASIVTGVLVLALAAWALVAGKTGPGSPSGSAKPGKEPSSEEDPLRRFLNRCHENLTNLEDDARIAQDVEAFRKIIDEHVSKCKPLLDHMDETIPR